MRINPHQKAPQQSPDFPDSFHRVAVKGLHVEDGKLLMSHDFILEDPVWELPGGGLDFGESIPDALRREVKEEMGLGVTWIDEKPTYIWTYRRDNARGMGWFYILLLAYRFEIKDLHDLVPSEECREVKFFSKEELGQTKNVSHQIKPLIELFNPADFV